ncbi:MAG: hypothetical protein IPG01_10545 [Chitinophagaceae bacterium]|nr:hypothetical protein [Chitinophagaceae bacterium]
MKPETEIAMELHEKFGEGVLPITPFQNHPQRYFKNQSDLSWMRSKQ